MLRIGAIGRIAQLGLIAVGLTACAETQLAVHAAKQAQRSQDLARADGSGDPPGVKVGKPYQVSGIWYYPKINPKYQATGVASWYGGKFHGRRTANGERYDMNGLTAAHKTLPMPSYVRVTNLENGRSLVLRINDRGPFVNERIIDVSRRASQLLGFRIQGTAKVRVTAVDVEGRPIIKEAKLGQAEKDELPALPQGGVEAKALPSPTQRTASAPGASATQGGARVASAPPRQDAASGGTAERVKLQPVKPTRLFVQAGAFLQYERANRLRARLSSIATSRVVAVLIDGQEFFRVRLGPLHEVALADNALARVMASGVNNARIVVD